MRKVAIIGKCSNTRRDAPIMDTSWEIWTLAWDLMPVTHRMFEMHDYWRNFRDNKEDAFAHLQTLAGSEVPVYMRQIEPEIPMSRVYPFQAITELVGTGSNGFAYLESSIAMMLGLAILECDPGDRIGIWGVDMGTKGEYSYQRPNMEYLIGFARGRGIKVWVPSQCELLASAHEMQYGCWKPEAVKAA